MQILPGQSPATKAQPAGHQEAFHSPILAPVLGPRAAGGSSSSSKGRRLAMHRCCIEGSTSTICRSQHHCTSAPASCTSHVPCDTL
jgi:hypothetical protein